MCRHLPQCVSYRWDTSPWSRCVFPHSYEKCGSGYRARGIIIFKHILWNPDPNLDIKHSGSNKICSRKSYERFKAWGVLPRISQYLASNLESPSLRIWYQICLVQLVKAVVYCKLLHDCFTYNFQYTINLNHVTF